jgi:hypothetical protein
VETQLGGEALPHTEDLWDTLPALTFDSDMYNTFFPFEMNEFDFFLEIDGQTQL